MVNEEKIRIMTKLAQHEKHSQKSEIREIGYSRIDYIRSHLLGTIGCYSLAYLLLLFLLGLYHFEYLMSVLRLQEIRTLAIGVLVVYLLIILGCSLLTVMVYSRKYQRLLKKKKEYLNLVGAMKAIYSDHGEEGSE